MSGIPGFDNPNGEMMESRGGAAINDLIVKDGQRRSIYRAYVHSRRGQSNLTVLTGTQVSRLLFEANAWSARKRCGRADWSASAPSAR